MVLYQIRCSLSRKPWSNNLERKFSQEVGREKDMERELRLSHCAAASSLVTRQNERISPLLLLIFHCPERKADNTNKHILTWLGENILTSFTNTHTAKWFKDIMQYIKPFTSGFHSNKSVFHDVNSSNTMATTTTWREKLGCEKWPAIFTRCNYRNTLLVFLIAKIAAEYKAVFFFITMPQKRSSDLHFGWRLSAKCFFNVMSMSSFLFTLNIARENCWTQDE